MNQRRRAESILLLRRPQFLGDLAFQLVELSQFRALAHQHLSVDHPVDLIVRDQLLLLLVLGLFEIDEVEVDLVPLEQRDRTA